MLILSARASLTVDCMTSSLTNLNDEQQQAVDHFRGACLVTAVPGSGKTSTLTSRVVNLIERGVDSRNICCVTFTNKAAKEMKDRITLADPGNQDRKITRLKNSHPR